jgi:hypothetical protein
MSDKLYLFCIPWLFFLLSCSFGSNQQDYRLNHQYMKSQHIIPQKNIEIHYFFSFQCASCAKLYPILEPYFHETVQEPIFFHPLAANQAGVQLIRAYDILRKHNQGQQCIRALYDAPSKPFLAEKDIFQLMKKTGHQNFEGWWIESDEQDVKTKMASDLRLAQSFKLSALPMIYILGPQGGFYLHPSPDLPLDKIPGCIEAVLSLQKTIDRPNPK